MKRFNKILLSLAITTSLVSCKTSVPTTQNSPAQDSITMSSADKVKMLEKAYLFGYPLLIMDYTITKSTNTLEPNSIGQAPINQKATFDQFPTSDFKNVVKPNVDTYYSTIYLDLSKEPIYIKLPATERYYLIPVLNAYSDVFVSLGTRTTGQGEQELILVGPDYHGELPKDVKAYHSTTNLNWFLGRVQVDNDEDGKLERVNFHDKIVVRPLSEKDNDQYIAPKGTFDSKHNFIPMEAVDALSTEAYFNKMMSLMATNPFYPEDQPFIDSLSVLGITVGGTFDMNRFTEDEQKAIENIPSKIQQLFKYINENPSKNNTENNWMVITDSIGLGNYKTQYALRAYVAKIGFGANQSVDAVYPNTSKDVTGELLNGSNNYVLHFDAEDLPPAKGFWSLTAYTKEGFLVPNQAGIYNVGNKTGVHYNDDGSIDIYIQNEKPNDPNANWLPSTKDGVGFDLTFRIYYPEESVLNKTWVMPGVQKMN